MTPTVSSSSNAHSGGLRLIAADVGGTHARVGLVQAIAGRAPVIVHQHRYACADFPGLAAILRSFTETAGIRSLDHAAVAIAGMLDGDTLLNTNLPWPVSLAQTRAESGLRRLEIINDFEALAFAMPYVDRSQATLLTGHAIEPGTGATLVLGPGTGLGAALRVPGSPPRVLASEAGHASLAAGNEVEIDILRWLLQRYPHADNERVLSGPGLLNVYRALCETRGIRAVLEQPAAITAGAQQGDDPLAVEALEVFCGMLGSLAGDLVLGMGAQEVCIAGGIPSQITPFLQRSSFVARFLNKGRLRPVLERTPVWLVEHGSLGIIGATSWYVESLGRDRAAA